MTVSAVAAGYLEAVIESERQKVWRKAYRKASYKKWTERKGNITFHKAEATSEEHRRIAANEALARYDAEVAAWKGRNDAKLDDLSGVEWEA